MYNYLRGQIIKDEDGILTIDCGGVGYLVIPSQSLWESIEKFSPSPDTSIVYIHHDVKETSHNLFGFVNTDEREAFTMLLSASGVGAKTAMAFLSIGFDNLVGAISGGDSFTLSKIKGVSSKLAEKAVIELRTKFSKRFPSLARTGGDLLSLGNNIPQSSKSAHATNVEEAVDTLVSLGMVRARVLEQITKQGLSHQSAEEIIAAVIRGK